MTNNRWYVYFHRKFSNGTPFYVGMGVKKRCYEFYGRNNLWDKIKSKHGIIVEIVHSNLTREQAMNLEMFYISMHGRIVNKTGILSNLTIGGDGSRDVIVSDETREKLSVAGKNKKRSEQTRKNISNALMGHKHSEETKRKIGQKSKERRAWIKALNTPMTEAGRNKIRELRNVKVIGDNVIYNSLKEAGEAVGLTTQGIYHRVNNKNYPEWQYLLKK